MNQRARRTCADVEGGKGRGSGVIAAETFEEPQGANGVDDKHAKAEETDQRSRWRRRKGFAG